VFIYIMGNPVWMSNVQKHPIYGKTVMRNVEEHLCGMRLLMILLSEVVFDNLPELFWVFSTNHMSSRC
jgi:hypothetical protein